MKKSRFMKGLTCILALLVLACFFGCSSSSNSSDPEVTVQGTVVDPIIAGSTYTYNANGRVITGKANDNGNYKFKLKLNEINDLEPIVFMGGIHKATGKKLKGKLKTLIKKSKVKNNVCNSIASFVTTLAVNSGEDKVKTAFGIEDVDDIFSFNHTKEANNGSASGIKVQKLNVQVSNTVESTSSLIMGSDSTANEDDIFDSVMDTFSTSITETTFTSFTDVTFINTFIDNSVQGVVSKNITTVSQTKIANVKSETINFISAINKEADDAEASGESAVNIITRLVSSQIVTTTTSTQIRTAASTGSASSISQIMTTTNTVSTVVSQTINQVITSGLTIVDPGTDNIDEGSGSSGGTDV